VFLGCLCVFGLEDEALYADACAFEFKACAACTRWFSLIALTLSALSDAYVEMTYLFLLLATGVAALGFGNAGHRRVLPQMNKFDALCR
jgi:hypothetical protein